MKFLKLGFFAAAISTAIISINLFRRLEFACYYLNDDCLYGIALAVGSISITLLFLGGAFWNPKKNKE